MLTNLTVSLPFEGDHQTEFQLESGSKRVRLSASTEKVRNDWVEAINSAVEHYQESRRTFLTTEEVEKSLVEEKLGDVKPVLFPRGLADTCQVGILLQILIVTKESPSRQDLVTPDSRGTAIGGTTAGAAEPLCAGKALP